MQKDMNFYKQYIINYFEQKTKEIENCYEYINENKEEIIKYSLNKKLYLKNDFYFLKDINNIEFNFKYRKINDKIDYLNILYNYVHKNISLNLYKELELLFNEDINEIIIKKTKNLVDIIINSNDLNNVKLVEQCKLESESLYNYILVFSTKVNFYNTNYFVDYEGKINKYSLNKKTKYLFTDKFSDIYYEGEYKYLNNDFIINEETIQLIDKIILNEKLNNNLKPIIKQKVKKI